LLLKLSYTGPVDY